MSSKMVEYLVSVLFNLDSDSLDLIFPDGMLKRLVWLELVCLAVHSLFLGMDSKSNKMPRK